MAVGDFAYGNTSFPDVPYLGFAGGVKTPFGFSLPASGNVVAYVRSTGSANLPPEIATKTVSTLARALKQCRASAGDTVVVLPGHTESVADATMLDNLKAGSKVMGWGNPLQSDAPVFNWTAAGSQWAISVANVSISGLNLQVNGANGVTKGINITAAGVSLTGNRIDFASGAALKATIGIEVGSAAHFCSIAGNYICGTATHNVTDGIKVVGATPPSDLLISGNHMMFSATAANGLIHVTVASLRMRILDNILLNTHTSSSATIAVDNVAADGVFARNMSGVLNDGTVTSQGIVFAGSALVKCFQNYSCDQPRLSGTLTPAAGT